MYRLYVHNLGIQHTHQKPIDFERSQDSAPELLQAVTERWQRRSPQAQAPPRDWLEMESLKSTN